MKNTLLLDSDLNATTICNENYTERAWETNSKMPAEINGSVTSMW